jgi:type IV secretory pathway VirB3-like protein
LITLVISHIGVEILVAINFILLIVIFVVVFAVILIVVLGVIKFVLLVLVHTHHRGVLIWHLPRTIRSRCRFGSRTRTRSWRSGSGSRTRSRTRSATSRCKKILGEFNVEFDISALMVIVSGH